MPDVRDRQQGCFPLGEWEKCLMCVSGRLSVGLIRCTGYVCQYGGVQDRALKLCPDHTTMV